MSAGFFGLLRIAADGRCRVLLDITKLSQYGFTVHDCVDITVYVLLRTYMVREVVRCSYPGASRLGSFLENFSGECP